MVHVHTGDLVVAEAKAERPWLVLGATTTVLFALAALLVPHSSGVARFDLNVMSLMWALREPGLTTVVEFITDLGSYRPVTVIEIGLALVLAYRTRRLLEPAVLLVAVEASSSLVEVLKLVTDRPRPPLEGMLGAPVFDYSFPSGHTASGTVLYVLGALMLAKTQRSSGRLLVAAGCLLGGLIGLSRVYLGYHWLTDVAGAWLLALIIVSIAMLLLTANPRPDPGTSLRHAVAPDDVFPYQQRVFS